MQPPSLGGGGAPVMQPPSLRGGGAPPRAQVPDEDRPVDRRRQGLDVLGTCVDECGWMCEKTCVNTCGCVRV